MTTKKLTIEDILKKKKLIEAEKNFYSTYFKAEIDIETIEPEKIVDIMQKDASEYEKYMELIYDSCPFFRNKKLHEALEVENPVDAVAKSYGSNYCEVFELGNFILKKYGFTIDKVEKVKKL